MSCVNETTIFGDRNFPLATILKMKVAKRRLIEKMNLERWAVSNDITAALNFGSVCICNGNRTEWSPIQSVIIRAITKSDARV